MRSFSAVCVLLATGCAAEPSAFDYQSTLSRGTRGLVLHDDGERGHAGMLGTNCPFETQQGTVTGDYDLPEQGEEVVDSGDLIGEDTVLLTLGDAAHLLEKSSGVYTHETLSFPGLRDARLIRGGLVALVEDGERCRLEWTAGASEDSLCGSLDVHGEDGTALVWGPEGAAVYDGTEARILDSLPSAAALDAASEAVYAAEESIVRAFDLDGMLRWEVADLGGEVRGLTEAGATGAAAVFVALEDGRGKLLYLDGATGSIQASVLTPGVADMITVSADGSTVAMVRPHEAHFYRLSGEWRE
jgi:hypothetical protein